MLSNARLVKNRGYALAFSHDYVQDGSRHRRKDVEVRRFHKMRTGYNPTNMDVKR